MQTADVRAREAALLLHGLAPKQREAVLERLEPGHLATLRPLLDELDALRIPPSLAQGLARTRAGAAAECSDDATAMPWIATLEPSRAGRALRACAAATVAAVLHDAPPAWREAVLAELPRDRRRDLGERLDPAPTLPPRVMEALRRRLQEEAAGVPAAGRSVARRVARGWRRWLRWAR